MSLKSRRTLTYSAAFTLVPTNECFNRCSYCNFRRDPHDADWLSIEQATKILSSMQGSGVSEILILSGEVHPQSSRRKAWLEHIYNLCELSLDHGFLPHSNVGPLSREEMTLLKRVNVSMGLMLEQLTPQLMKTVHREAPNKAPQIRLEQLNLAGELGIPFTTGLLLGLGESRNDWQQTLEAIAASHQQWGHIQEVILQPYQPGSLESWHQNPFEINVLPDVVTLAKEILPDSISIQIPPNLIPELSVLQTCLEAGVSDLGGIVPHDHVNPDYDHLPFPKLFSACDQWGFDLKPRLPVYSQFIPRLSKDLRRALTPWLDSQKVLGY